MAFQELRDALEVVKKRLGLTESRLGNAENQLNWARGFRIQDGMTYDPTSSFTTVPISGSGYAKGMTWGSNAFTVDESGWYELSASVAYTPGATGLGTSIVGATIRVNGVGMGDTVRREWPQSNNESAMVLQTTRSLSAGAVITIAAARSAALTGAVITRVSLSVRRVN